MRTEFSFNGNFLYHEKYILEKRKESSAQALIRFCFSFKKLAAHFQHKAYSYRLLCYRFIQESEKGKRMIDGEIFRLIDSQAFSIFNTPHKSNTSGKNMDLDKLSFTIQ